MKKSTKGRPRGFRSAKHLIEWLYEFCESIVDEGFKTVPTQTEFIRWCIRVKGLEVSPRTLSKAINHYYPDIRAEWEQIRSDTLVYGGAIDKYKQSMAIFALKNWCGWSDNVQPDMSVQTSVVLPPEADEEAY